MAVPKRPWSQRMREILADGQWHAMTDLVLDAGKLIPPSYAIRTAERIRTTGQRAADRDNESRRRRGPRTVTQDEAIRSGRRALLSNAIRSWTDIDIEVGIGERGRIEKVRIKPDGRGLREPEVPAEQVADKVTDRVLAEHVAIAARLQSVMIEVIDMEEARVVIRKVTHRSPTWIDGQDSFVMLCTPNELVQVLASPVVTKAYRWPVPSS